VRDNIGYNWNKVSTTNVKDSYRERVVSSVEVKSMKCLGLIVASAILLLGDPAVTFASNFGGDNLMVSQNIVNIITDPDGQQVQYSTIAIDRRDLRQPHILRVWGETNNKAIPMEQVEVKINGKVVKTIANSFLELNLSPLLNVGRYIVEVSGTSVYSNVTISLNFTGINTQVNQKSSGSGRIKQKLIINIQ
jgi:hypothetical protein